MKTFIGRSLLVLISSLLGYLLVMFLLPEFKNPTSEFPKNYEPILAKLDSCQIIICGDSRADRQLDPAIIHAATGLNTINIAAPSWDIYALSKVLIAAKITRKTLIISASFFQMNDGAMMRAILVMRHLRICRSAKNYSFIVQGRSLFFITSGTCFPEGLTIAVKQIALAMIREL